MTAVAHGLQIRLKLFGSVEIKPITWRCAAESAKASSPGIGPQSIISPLSRQLLRTKPKGIQP